MTGQIFNRAVQLHQAGRLVEAEGLYRQALGVTRDDPNLNYLHGAVLFQLQRLPEALKAAEAALALAPAAAEILVLHGVLLRSFGRLNEALVSVDRALAQAPGLADALSNRALILWDLNRMEAALEALDRLIAVDPEAADPWVRRAMALFRLGRTAEAGQSAETALDRRPEHPAAWSVRGQALLRLGRFADADRTFGILQQNYGGTDAAKLAGKIAGIGFGEDANQIDHDLSAIHRTRHGIGDIGAMARQFGQKCPGAKGKDATVPRIAALGEKGLGAGKVGLFDKAFNLPATGAGNRGALLQIAEAGFGRGRGDAERDQPIVRGKIGGGVRGGAKCGHIADVVVAGADQHHGIGGQAHGGQRDCRGGVAGRGFDDDRRLGACGHLRLDQGNMRGTGHHDRIGKARSRIAARNSGGKQRGIADQRQERFGPSLARTRPQPGAAAAAQNYGNDHGHAKTCLLPAHAAGSIRCAPGLIVSGLTCHGGKHLRRRLVAEAFAGVVAMRKRM